MAFWGAVLRYYLVDAPPTWVASASMPGVILLLSTLFFRYARVFMLHFFSGVKFDPSYSRR